MSAGKSNDSHSSPVLGESSSKKRKRSNESDSDYNPELLDTVSSVSNGSHGETRPSLSAGASNSVRQPSVRLRRLPDTRQPLRFHSICGENVVLGANGKSARRVASYNKALCFSDRPISVAETIRLRPIGVSSRCYRGVLRVGVTHHSPESLAADLPKYLAPDLAARPGTWVAKIAEEDGGPGAVLQFWVTASGSFWAQIGGRREAVQRGIDVAKPLYLVLDIYGRTREVEFMDDNEPLPGDNNGSASTAAANSTPAAETSQTSPSALLPGPAAADRTSSPENATTSQIAPAAPLLSGPTNSEERAVSPESESMLVFAGDVEDDTDSGEDLSIIDLSLSPSPGPEENAEPEVVESSGEAAAANSNSALPSLPIIPLEDVTSALRDAAERAPEASSSAAVVARRLGRQLDHGGFLRRRIEQTRRWVSRHDPLGPSPYQGSSVQERDAQVSLRPPIRHHAGIRLAPIQFHPFKGSGVVIREDVCAIRNDTQTRNSYVFTCRPINALEKLVVQIVAASSGPLGLTFGLTNCNPDTLEAENVTLPDDANALLDRGEYWLVKKRVSPAARVSDELGFFYDQEGKVFCQKNHEAPEIIMHLDATQTFWMFFDVCGNTETIRLLGTVPMATSPSVWSTGRPPAPAPAATRFSYAASGRSPGPGPADLGFRSSLQWPPAAWSLARPPNLTPSSTQASFSPQRSITDFLAASFPTSPPRATSALPSWWSGPPFGGPLAPPAARGPSRSHDQGLAVARRPSTSRDQGPSAARLLPRSLGPVPQFWPWGSRPPVVLTPLSGSRVSALAGQLPGQPNPWSPHPDPWLEQLDQWSRDPGPFPSRPQDQRARDQSDPLPGQPDPWQHHPGPVRSPPDSGPGDSVRDWSVIRPDSPGPGPSSSASFAGPSTSAAASLPGPSTSGSGPSGPGSGPGSSLQPDSGSGPGEEGKASRFGDCAICLSKPINMVLVPCGHMCMCSACCEDFQRRGSKEICPVCRQVILRYQPVFLACASN